MSKTPPQSDKPKTIFVSRERMGITFSLGNVTDEQRALLKSAQVYLWPRAHEFTDGDALRETLVALHLDWHAKKDGL